MERDRNMQKLFRESGILHAPERFTRDVMDRIEAEPEKTHFKPLIGRTGRIIILLCVIALILVSIFYTGPQESPSGFRLPDLSFDLQFLSQIRLPTGFLAALAAIFILVLSDAGLSRKRFA
jgi:hypothetical protein